MELWIFTALLVLLQSSVQPIKVDDSSSQFLIVANAPKEDLQSSSDQNDLQYHIFKSNRSRPRIKPEKQYTISPPTLQSINLLGVHKSEKKDILSPSVEITPAHSEYLGYTIGSQLHDVSSFSQSPKENVAKTDLSYFKSTIKEHPPTRHASKKHTQVKLPKFQKKSKPYHSEYESNNQKYPNIENTIHRPSTSDLLQSEKPVHEYFSSDLEDLIEKAEQMDHKKRVGSLRKNRNSEDDLAGHRSDKYEVEEYLDHQPYVESDGEYHVYHGEKKKKKKEVHYHQHKHLHEHDHDQKHTHKHQAGHHHDHGHDHRQKHTHSHGHDDDHWHDHHEKGEHHHQSHHDHSHHGSHDHKHGEDHDHKHESGHHHGHDDHHDHHEDHKNWHGHKHHSDHDHRHGHDHKHKGKHGHDHHHNNKHKHNHHHKHSGKH